MKKVLFLTLLMGMMMGCQPAEKGEPDILDIPADEYVWEEVGAIIELPEGTMENCDVTVDEDGAVWFSFRDGGDTAFWLRAYEKGVETPMEEQLGVFTLGETETHTIQIMTSTCGTLNNEKIRDLWDMMRAKAAQMTEENILILEQ